jgi:hypothetical protein
MRPVDELARFWSDTQTRMPTGSWLWLLAAVSGSALLTLIGAGSSEAPAEAKVTVAVAPAASCDSETWPYFSDACLKREQPNKPVRMLSYDPTLAKAAIGATPWAQKDSTAARHRSSRQKQATHNNDRSRKVTVRSGGREPGARERVYQVPPDAYRAYGYAPR